jgi:hypothetical protein
MANNKRDGYGKLLDCWMPPKEAGEPIGCLATTYTFDPELFEEECLSRFLKMDTEYDEDGALYLIEREEKLCAIKCASVLVDQTHSNKQRSLRWDMLSMRYSGTFHPKISLLYWSGCIRLIVASANLSKPGYRENQEIFGVVDFFLDAGKIIKADAPIHILKNYIDFLRKIILDYSLSGDKVNKRSIDLLESIQKIAQQWTPPEVKIDNRQIHLESILIGPGRKDMFEQLQEIWIQYSSKLPHTAWITSPFYNSPDAQNLPAEKIWTILSTKKDAAVNYTCCYEPSHEEGKKYLIMAPESLKVKRIVGRALLDISFRGISISAKDENGNVCFRSPHLKSILLENDDWVMYMVGSSNFTSSGTGLITKCNYEANLVYIINTSKNPEGFAQLQSSFPKDDYFEQNEIEFSRIGYSEEDGEPLIPSLPIFFKECEAIWDNGIFIRFHFDKKHKTGNFRICDDTGSFSFHRRNWIEKNEPEFYLFPWTEKHIPSGFNVYLEDDALVPAFWPLNVENSKVLPTPDELKNLKLEDLIEILSSSKSLISVMRKILKEKMLKNAAIDFNKEYIDPHKRVDTSGYILQRTRRMSHALSALSERISRPVYTKESLDWRLYGPVGVNALCEAMVKEVEKTHLDEDMKKEELLFFMAELALEFINIDPTVNTNSLTKDEIISEFKKFLQNLYFSNKKLITANRPSPIRNYAKKAFKTIHKT